MPSSEHEHPLKRSVAILHQLEPGAFGDVVKRMPIIVCDHGDVREFWTDDGYCLGRCSAKVKMETDP